MLVLALISFVALTILNEVKTESLRDKLLLGSGGGWFTIGAILLGNPFPVALKTLATQVVCSRFVQKLIGLLRLPLNSPFIDVDVMSKVFATLDLPMEQGFKEGFIRGVLYPGQYGFPVVHEGLELFIDHLY